MPPPSLARNFFERIIERDAIAFIRGLINSTPPTVETDWRDFKTEHPDPKQRERYIREEWSRSLGGFANNQGGVLVWGVDARKTKVGGVEIDAACAEKPVTNPQALRSRLMELQRGATDPPLGNVDIKAYELADKPGTGFVVCYIPEGPFKPYRSEQAERQWFIRAGDNTVVMSRSMLQALFYPRTKAVFRFEADLSWCFPDEGKVMQRMVNELTLEVWMSNVGTATGKDILLRVESNVSDLVGMSQLGPGWQREKGYLRKLNPTHPGLPASEVLTAQWEVPTASSLSKPGGKVPSCQDPKFAFVIYAENQEPQHFDGGFDMDELIRSRQVRLILSPEVSRNEFWFM